MLDRWRDKLAGYKEHLVKSLPGASTKASDELAAQTHAEVSNLTNKLLHTEHSEQQKFAAAFCYGQFTVFCFPLMSAWMVAFDKDVMYWFGTYVFWWTLPIPFGFFIVYLYHLRRGRLKRGFILGSVIIPCVIFFLLGTSLRFKSEHLKDHLLSVDCQTYPIMKELEIASKEANQLYDQCNPHGYDVLFPACADFDKWKRDTNNERTWDYLQHLETNCLCTGFCKSGVKPIWTHTEEEDTHDACSMCVIIAIDAHIWRVGEQMMASGLIILSIFLLWQFFMEPSIFKLDGKKERYEAPQSLMFGYGSMPSPTYIIPPPLLSPVPVVNPTVPVSFKEKTPVSFRPASPVSMAQVPPILAIVDGPPVSAAPSWPSTTRSYAPSSPRSASMGAASMPPVMTSMTMAPGSAVFARSL